MNVLALFAGIGGLELGVGLAVRGARTVCYVERDAYAAACLVARMEDAALEEAPIWDDVSTFDGKPWRGVVDCVAGGFPCQDISVAGSGAGLEGARSGLWREYARIVREVGPSHVFVENVPALTFRGLDRVLGDLAELGFDAEWDVFSAAGVGAPHLRRRIFILAKRVSDPGRDRSHGELGWRSRKKTGPFRPSLHEWARRWPTASANDWKGSSKPGQRRGQLDETVGSRGRRDRETPKGGSDGSTPAVLNPRFVEALMGLPIGWTDSDASATASCRQWRRGLSVN